MTSGRQKAGEHSRSRLHEPDAYGGSKVGASSIASKPSASYQDSEGRMEDGGVSQWIRGAWDWMGLVIDNEGSTCRDHLGGSFHFKASSVCLSGRRIRRDW